VISIDKSALEIVIRRNPLLLEQMISKWNGLVEQRVNNKDLVNQNQAAIELKRMISTNEDSVE
jgi:hypothetical protein